MDIKKLFHNKNFLKFSDLSLNLIIIIGMVLIIQKWVIAPFAVFGSSMCNTLNYIDSKCEENFGEKIMLNEAIYLFNNPERGDIVVFHVDPTLNHNIDTEKKYYIKRVIGLPGETIEIKDGYVYVSKKDSQNSIKLEEKYLNDFNLGNTNPHIKSLSVFHVPENQYFVLGDNRNFSTDSRSCFQRSTSDECKNNASLAFVPVENIRGKAMFVWWPLKNTRLVQKPEYKELEEN